MMFDHLKLKRLMYHNGYVETQCSGVDQSENNAYDSNGNVEEESYSLNCQKLTAKVVIHSFTNSQNPDFRRSHLRYDNMRGDNKTSHDEVSEEEDDIDLVKIDMDFVLSPDDK